MDILFLNLIVLCGFFAQGLTGFGSGTLTAAVLALWLPLKQVVPVVALLVALPNLIMLYLVRRDLDLRRGALAALGLTLGVIMGASMLAALPGVLLKRCLGVVILALVAFFLLRTPTPRDAPAFDAVDVTLLGLSALISGIIVGAIGVGPIPLLAYIGARYPKGLARAVLTEAFSVAAVVQNATYLYLGLLNPDLARMALFAIPGIALGLWLGNRLHYRVAPQTFARGLALLLIFPAIKLIAW